MSGFNIIMVIAVILFARLGVRLFTKWKELNKPESKEDATKLADKSDNKTEQPKN
jgi:hypothetical protein